MKVNVDFPNKPFSIRVNIREQWSFQKSSKYLLQMTFLVNIRRQCAKSQKSVEQHLLCDFQQSTSSLWASGASSVAWTILILKLYDSLPNNFLNFVQLCCKEQQNCIICLDLIALIFFFLKIDWLIDWLIAVLGLRFCARAFSSCGKRGPLFIAVRGPLTIVASLVAEHRLQTRRLSSCGA